MDDEINYAFVINAGAADQLKTEARRAKIELESIEKHPFGEDNAVLVATVPEDKSINRVTGSELAFQEKLVVYRMDSVDGSNFSDIEQVFPKETVNVDRQQTTTSSDGNETASQQPGLGDGGVVDEGLGKKDSEETAGAPQADDEVELDLVEDSVGQDKAELDSLAQAIDEIVPDRYDPKLAEPLEVNVGDYTDSELGEQRRSYIRSLRSQANMDLADMQSEVEIANEGISDEEYSRAKAELIQRLAESHSNSVENFISSRNAHMRLNNSLEQQIAEIGAEYQRKEDEWVAARIEKLKEQYRRENPNRINEVADEIIKEHSDELTRLEEDHFSARDQLTREIVRQLRHIDGAGAALAATTRLSHRRDRAEEDLGANLNAFLKLTSPENSPSAVGQSEVVTDDDVESLEAVDDLDDLDDDDDDLADMMTDSEAKDSIGRETLKEVDATESDDLDSDDHEKTTKEKIQGFLWIGTGVTVVVLLALFVWPGFLSSGDEPEPAHVDEIEQALETDVNENFKLGDTLRVVSSGNQLIEVTITSFDPDGGARAVDEKGKEYAVSQRQLDDYHERYAGEKR